MRVSPLVAKHLISAVILHVTARIRGSIQYVHRWKYAGLTIHANRRLHDSNQSATQSSRIFAIANHVKTPAHCAN